MTNSAQQVISELKAVGSPEKAQQLSSFFKTRKGEYGEGDCFLGITVPKTRAIAKAYLDLPFLEIDILLKSEWHEVRLCGLLILVLRFKKKTTTETEKAEIYRFYLAHAHCCNNWDLVDLSCPYIVGTYLLDKDRNRLFQLANSQNLWEQRIAIVSTLMLIRHGFFEDTLRLAVQLMKHQHDLIQKAVGWMLREVGKKDRDLLTAFLNQHKKQLARTTLRYAIEHYDKTERQEFMA